MSGYHPPSSTPKKTKHPTTQKMVDKAVTELNDSKGCSFTAIKKFIVTSYQVDIRKLNIYIKKYLRTSVEIGKFIQMTGSGANGSFRLSAAAKRDPKKFLKKSTSGKKTKLRKQAGLRNRAVVNTNSRRSTIRLSISRRWSGRPLKPRKAKVGVQYSLCSESDEAPSTSMQAKMRPAKLKKENNSSQGF